MNGVTAGRRRFKSLSMIAISVSIGIALGVVGGQGLAQMAAPSEHKGLDL